MLHPAIRKKCCKQVNTSKYEGQMNGQTDEEQRSNPRVSLQVTQKYSCNAGTNID